LITLRASAVATSFNLSFDGLAIGTFKHEEIYNVPMLVSSLPHDFSCSSLGFKASFSLTQVFLNQPHQVFLNHLLLDSVSSWSRLKLQALLKETETINYQSQPHFKVVFNKHRAISHRFKTNKDIKETIHARTSEDGQRTGHTLYVTKFAFEINARRGHLLDDGDTDGHHHQFRRVSLKRDALTIRRRAHLYGRTLRQR
jgi:hypothetical protein